MCDSRKIVKILTIINIIILVGMYLFCFINQPGNIPGVCDECAAGTSITFTFATMVFIILAIMAIIMSCNAWNIKSKGKCVTILILSIVSILFALLERAIFSGNPSVGWHEDMTEKALKLVDLLDVQYVAARIISILLMVWNGLMVGASIYGLKRWEDDFSNPVNQQKLRESIDRLEAMEKKMHP